MAVDPVQPTLKTGQYGDEPGAFTDFNNLFRYFATKSLRPSRTSPPIAADIEELTLVYDKTLDRIYTKSNGTLRYVQFT